MRLAMRSMPLLIKPRYKFCLAFVLKKTFNFLRLNKSDPLKSLKLNNFNISDLSNLLI